MKFSLPKPTKMNVNIRRQEPTYPPTKKAASTAPPTPGSTRAERSTQERRGEQHHRRPPVAGDSTGRELDHRGARIGQIAGDADVPPQPARVSRAGEEP